MQCTRNRQAVSGVLAWTEYFLDAIYTPFIMNIIVSVVTYTGTPRADPPHDLQLITGIKNNPVITQGVLNMGEIFVKC